MELKGTVALVTGAAQGIGKACVNYLLAEGVKVMISDINKTVGEATKKEMAKEHGESNVEFIYCDVTDDESFEDLFKETIKKFGKLDLLINNAGIANELMDDGWKQTIKINFMAVVKGTYLGMKYMGKHEGKQGGTIVNIGSVATFEPFECIPVYSATKSAVNQFSRSIGTKLHYDRTGVGVISVNPGLTDTAILPGLATKIDKSTEASFLNVCKEYKIQSVENMGKGIITVLKKAEPGSLWVIENDVAPKRIEFEKCFYKEFIGSSCAIRRRTEKFAKGKAKELRETVALVTGAAQGIGKAYVDYLLAEGVKVMIADINKTVGEATKKELGKKHRASNVEFIYCDVTIDESFEDLFKETIKKFGKLDLLINNAGIGNELMDDGWKQTIKINFMAVVKGTYLGMKYMGKHEGKQGGTIVNIASLTSYTPSTPLPVYSATKSAVNQFSRSIGTKLHYDRTGVRVISVNPGCTDTALIPSMAKQIDKSTETSFLNACKENILQSVENMGKGMITVLKKAEPGSLWAIEDDVAPKRIEFKMIKHDN